MRNKHRFREVFPFVATVTHVYNDRLSPPTEYYKVEIYVSTRIKTIDLIKIPRDALLSAVRRRLAFYGGRQ